MLKEELMKCQSNMCTYHTNTYITEFILLLAVKCSIDETIITSDIDIFAGTYVEYVA